jgi:hypothetical protein
MTKEVPGEGPNLQSSHLDHSAPNTGQRPSPALDEDQANRDYVHWISRTLDHQVRGLTELGDPRSTLSRTPWDNMAEFLLSRSKLLIDPLTPEALAQLPSTQQKQVEDKFVQGVKAVVKKWRDEGVL